MRCGRCGNENSETNRFCGMCGAPLLGKTQAGGQATAGPAGSIATAKPAAVSVQSGPVVTVPRQAAASGSVEVSDATTERRPMTLSGFSVEPSAEPVIAGPSFLGLNKPADAGRDGLRASSSVDYLLEDDEEEPKRGWGKWVLVLVALALAAGFGYLHWKQGGLDWLNGGAKKPAATTTDGAQNGADSGSSTGAANPNGATSPAGGEATTPGGVASPAAPGAAQASATQSASPGTAVPSPDSSQAGAPQTTSSPTTASPGPADTAAQSAASGSAASGPGSGDRGTAAFAAQDADSSGQAIPEPAAPKAATRKPAAGKPPTAKPYDPVTDAERYIYGRGVRQDCDHGMREMKTAAEQSNAKAMISLGALYSAGTCAPRDLPTAYRWIALALHKEPDDQALQEDLQKLWSQMTQPERQLAIKLSQ